MIINYHNHNDSSYILIYLMIWILVIISDIGYRQLAVSSSQAIGVIEWVWYRIACSLRECGERREKKKCKTCKKRCLSLSFRLHFYLSFCVERSFSCPGFFIYQEPMTFRFRTNFFYYYGPGPHWGTVRKKMSPGKICKSWSCVLKSMLQI